jgi:hypothetical protein
MSEKYPIGDFSLNKSPSEIKIGFYCATVYSDMPYPILPHKSSSNKLMFTNGILKELF